MHPIAAPAIYESLYFNRSSTEELEKFHQVILLLSIYYALKGISMSKYSWDAEDYAKHSSAQLGWARELISKLNLNGDENILDIGCGDGKVTAEIAANVPNGSVVGVDNSESMIDLAETNYPATKYPNLSFQLADAQKLPFEQKFEVVFSNAALHWVIDHIPVLEGIYKSLRPGGRILLQMGGQGNAASVISVLDEVKAEAEWCSYFKDFEFPYGFHCPKDYKRWLKYSGFNPIRVELFTKDMIHEGRSGLAGWIRTIWLPYTQRIPKQKREVFVDEIVNRYIQKNPPDSEGKIYVKMVRLEVEAIKNA